MAEEVVWSPQALAHLDKIAAYIQADSPRSASKMVEKLKAAGDSLRDYAERGQSIGGGLRRLVVWPYALGYRRERSCVRILYVRHGARRPFR